MTVFLSAPSLLSNDSMRGFQQRFVQRGLQVSGYRNLNKQGYFSLLSREGVDKGRVICHAPAFHLRSGKQPAIKISSASQQRAQRQQQRNVHAFCNGELVDVFARQLAEQELVDLGFLALTYNPFLHHCFTYVLSQRDFVESDKPHDIILCGSYAWVKPR